MAGTGKFRVYGGVIDLGHSPPISVEYDIDSIDEVAYQYSELAVSTSVQLSVGSINAVNAVVIRLITGGTTLTTGLGVDLQSVDYTSTDAPHYTILQGEAAIVRPPTGTSFSVSNLSGAVVAIFEYLIVGQNA